jgi:23S rRNA pseudouridine2605 synthase
MKLQKRLAETGLGSRRAMEALIQAGVVTVNGATAVLGVRVSARDRIAVRGEDVPAVRFESAPRLPRVVLYHKPEGEIVSRADPEGRPSVFDRVVAISRGRWLAVGRLDFNTCGLLIFTDSGALANRLTHPRFEIRRDYAVRVVGELTPEQLRSLRTGVALDDGPGRFDVIEHQGGEGTNRWYRVSVKEGRNRLIRRMFAAIGTTVSRLMRTRFGPFELPPRLKRGQWMKLEPDAVKVAMQALERLHSGGGESGRKPARREVSRAGTGPVRRTTARVRVTPAPAPEARAARTPHRRRHRSRST